MSTTRAVSFAGMTVGSTYGREELASRWGYAGVEALARGVVTPRDDNKIILFVTIDKPAVADHYDNELSGTILLWEGRKDHFAEDRIANHRQAGDAVHLFYRKHHRDDFTYAGEVALYCCQLFADRPSRYVFRLRAAIS